MPYKFNVFTGTLDLTTSKDVGDVKSTGPSTDKAIVRFSGTTGLLIDNSKAIVQDGGAIETQALLQKRNIDDDVNIPDGYVLIDQDINLTTGDVTLEGDGEITLVD